MRSLRQIHAAHTERLFREIDTLEAALAAEGATTLEPYDGVTARPGGAAGAPDRTTAPARSTGRIDDGRHGADGERSVLTAALLLLTAMLAVSIRLEVFVLFLILVVVVSVRG